MNSKKNNPAFCIISHITSTLQYFAKEPLTPVGFFCTMKYFQIISLCVVSEMAFLFIKPQHKVIFCEIS
jgi:hypothetical protein